MNYFCSVPAPGYFNDDDTIDFMARFNYGAGFPVYYHSNVSIFSTIICLPIKNTVYCARELRRLPLEMFIFLSIYASYHYISGGLNQLK